MGCPSRQRSIRAEHLEPRSRGRCLGYQEPVHSVSKLGQNCLTNCQGVLGRKISTASKCRVQRTIGRQPRIGLFAVFLQAANQKASVRKQHHRGISCIYSGHLQIPEHIKRRQGPIAAKARIKNTGFADLHKICAIHILDLGDDRSVSHRSKEAQISIHVRRDQRTEIDSRVNSRSQLLGCLRSEDQVVPRPTNNRIASLQTNQHVALDIVVANN